MRYLNIILIFSIVSVLFATIAVSNMAVAADFASRAKRQQIHHVESTLAAVDSQALDLQTLTRVVRSQGMVVASSVGVLFVDHRVALNRDVAAQKQN